MYKNGTSTYCYQIPKMDYAKNEEKKKVAFSPPEILNDEFLRPPCVVQSGDILVADMVLISGRAVLDESAITGEAQPIPKQSFRRGEVYEDHYVSENLRQFTLFSGSTVIESRAGAPSKASFIDQNTSISTHCFALVIATGFSTSKGELFRNILFPAKVEMKLNQDTNYFMIMLVIFALIAFTFRMITGIEFKQTWDFIVLYSFDLITIAIPPALPLILTIGTGFALGRLKKKDILCIEPQRINFAGKVNLMALDKTGTLTEESLYFHSIVQLDPKHCKFMEPVVNVPKNSLMERIMVSCHSLSKLGDALAGNSVDKNMFKETNWNFLDQNEFQYEFPHYVAMVSPPDAPSNTGIGILKSFDFDPKLARASVICKDEKSQKVFAACKGSAESILHICLPGSIPQNYQTFLQNYYSKGFYVLACCYKLLPSQLEREGEFKAVNRDQIESGGFVFAGLLVLSNPLKKDAQETINALIVANVKAVMITGDSIYTAISVARELKMVNSVMVIDMRYGGEGGDKDDENMTHQSRKGLCFHIFGDITTTWKPLTDVLHIVGSYQLAITGAALDELSQSTSKDSLVTLLLPLTKIFARTKPIQKSWIIRQYIKQGHFVGMCGDGMNDCGALKIAHIGIALSNTDASMVAPFTSKNKKLYDVVELLLEGRCALETAFVAFKYMILYPVIQRLAEQTMQQTTLTYIDDGLSVNEFILNDMFYVLGLSTTMLYTPARLKLTHEVVPDSLFDPAVLSSIFGQVLITTLFFSGSLLFLGKQSWFCTISQLYAYNKFPNYSNYSISKIHPQELCFMIPPNAEDDHTYGYENNTVWLYSSVQYVIVAIAFNVACDFRAPMYKNYYFCIYTVIAIVVGIWFILTPMDILAFNIIRDNVPASFFQFLVYLIIINTVVSILWEYLIVNRFIPFLKRGCHRFSQNREEKSQKEFFSTQQQEFPMMSNVI